MPRIIDYATAPVQKRRVSITDEMADEVREILGRNLTAEDVAREFENDSEVQEVIRELIAEDVDPEPYPGWAMGLGISENQWSEHYEDVDRAVRVKRKFAAKRAAIAAEYAKKMEKLDIQERRMMPVWSPQSKLIREITSLVYKGLQPQEIARLDQALGDLKIASDNAKCKEAANPRNTDEKVSVNQVEYAEDNGSDEAVAVN